MRILILILFLLPNLCFSQLNPQSKKITKKFFPNPNLEISTPAFSKKKGFTSYNMMMSFINDLVKDRDDVSLSFIGESQKGKSIPMVKISNDLSDDKLKVWFQAGMHGNEPASTEGILYLMQQLLLNDKYSYLFDRLELIIIPMVNIDGYEKNNRYAANGLDLNRDHTKLMIPESNSLKNAFSKYGAEVTVDFHEYTPFRKDFTKIGDFGISNIYDVMILYTGNLNVPKLLRNYTNDIFVTNAREKLESNNLRYHDYIVSRNNHGSIHFHQGSNSARSSCTAYALSNSVSSLIEVRGVGIGKTSFQRRVNSTFLVALSYLETAYNNVQNVKKVLRDSKQTENAAVLKSTPAILNSKIECLDLGSSEKIVLDVILHDKFNAKADLTRERPHAYLFRNDNKLLIKKLKTLGLELTSVAKSQTVKVEKYIVDSYEKSSMKYEGVFMQKVKTTTEYTDLDIDKFWYLLNMNQKNANLAIEVLEPEAPNSFVSYNIIKTNKNLELPYFRLLKK